MPNRIINFSKKLLDWRGSLYLRIVVLLLTVWVAVTVMAIAVFPSLAVTLATTTNLTSQSSYNHQAIMTLVDRFEVQAMDVEEFINRWSAINEYMKQKNGFISAELSNKPIGSRNWVMSEKWESLEEYKAAVSTKEFQSLIQKFPAKATWFAPELFSSK